MANYIYNQYIQVTENNVHVESYHRCIQHCILYYILRNIWKVTLLNIA